MVLIIIVFMVKGCFEYGLFSALLLSMLAIRCGAMLLLCGCGYVAARRLLLRCFGRLLLG